MKLHETAEALAAYDRIVVGNVYRIDEPICSETKEPFPLHGLLVEVIAPTAHGRSTLFEWKVRLVESDEVVIAACKRTDEWWTDERVVEIYTCPDAAIEVDSSSLVPPECNRCVGMPDARCFCCGKNLRD